MSQSSEETEGEDSGSGTHTTIALSEHDVTRIFGMAMAIHASALPAPRGSERRIDGEHMIKDVVRLFPTVTATYVRIRDRIGEGVSEELLSKGRSIGTISVSEGDEGWVYEVNILPGVDLS